MWPTRFHLPRMRPNLATAELGSELAILVQAWFPVLAPFREPSFFQEDQAAVRVAFSEAKGTEEIAEMSMAWRLGAGSTSQ